MALETPISAWQPPIAAESVAPFLNRLPISPAVSRKSLDRRLVRRRRSRRRYISTAGITPAAPLVGAVTTRPNAAFSSFTARAKQLTHLRISRNPRAAPADRGHPGVDVASNSASPEQRRDSCAAARRTTPRPPGRIPVGVAAAEDAVAHRRPRSAAGRRRISSSLRQVRSFAPDDLGDRQAVRPAVPQQVGRRLDRASAGRPARAAVGRVRPPGPRSRRRSSSTSRRGSSRPRASP